MAEKQIKYRTPLRQAQRELTRTRIKQAAQKLFYLNHYDNTTLGDIAKEAGLRRSTIYLHFKDKSDILVDAVSEYSERATAILSTLPGPHVTVEEVSRWLRKIVRFQAKEQALLSIVLELQNYGDHKDVLERLIADLLGSLGTNNPAFVKASRAESAPRLRAQGLILLQEMTYTGGIYLKDPNDPRSSAMLDIAAEDLVRFLSSPANLQAEA